MADEVIPQIESGQEQVATAAPESVEVEAPETVGDKPEVPPKTFTQEELDNIVTKRLAREQRKWQREQETRTVTPAPVITGTDDLKAEQFTSHDEYVQALAARKAEELIAARESQQQRSQLEKGYHEREELARDKYDDFEQVAYNPKVPISDHMADVIKASDIGPDIAYYLGSNVKEAARIAQLNPMLQAKEIGKIEARLSDNPPVKKTTSVPAPVNPVTARSSSQVRYDTTDPRSTKAMSDSEWIEAERQRQIRKIQQASKH